MAVQGVLRGVLRQRLQGAARRRVLRGPGGVPQHVPQLGLPGAAADLRRVAHRPRRCGWGGRLMCRHLAYLGEPATLRSVLVDPPHSLQVQAWAPRRQRPGAVNADGFGVGWYADGDPVPARYRQAGPIWADQCFSDLARVTRTSAMLAAVRSATAGTDAGASAAAPYAHGRWL